MKNYYVIADLCLNCPPHCVHTGRVYYTTNNLQRAISKAKKLERKGNIICVVK